MHKIHNFSRTSTTCNGPPWGPLMYLSNPWWHPRSEDLFLLHAGRILYQNWWVKGPVTVEFATHLQLWCFLQLMEVSFGMPCPCPSLQLMKGWLDLVCSAPVAFQHAVSVAFTLTTNMPCPQPFPTSQKLEAQPDKLLCFQYSSFSTIWETLTKQWHYFTWDFSAEYRWNHPFWSYLHHVPPVSLVWPMFVIWG